MSTMVNSPRLDGESGFCWWGWYASNCRAGWRDGNRSYPLAPENRVPDLDHVFPRCDRDTGCGVSACPRLRRGNHRVSPVTRNLRMAAVAAVRVGAFGRLPRDHPWPPKKPSDGHETVTQPKGSQVVAGSADAPAQCGSGDVGPEDAEVPKLGVRITAEGPKSPAFGCHPGRLRQGTAGTELGILQALCRRPLKPNVGPFSSGTKPRIRLVRMPPRIKRPPRTMSRRCIVKPLVERGQPIERNLRPFGSCNVLVGGRPPMVGDTPCPVFMGT